VKTTKSSDDKLFTANFDDDENNKVLFLKIQSILLVSFPCLRQTEWECARKPDSKVGEREGGGKSGRDGEERGREAHPCVCLAFAGMCVCVCAIPNIWLLNRLRRFN
jgi:hypothetical protein